MLVSEKWNVYSHLFGAILSLIGFTPLMYYAISSDDFYRMIGIPIYGLCLIILFSSSVLYHSSVGKKREYLQKLDHISIFLLISGTYTPYMLITLRDSSGFYILTTIWSISAIGIVFKFFLAHKFDFLSTLLYLFCGWLIIFDFGNFYNTYDRVGFYWLGAGGLAYSIGAVFFLWEKLPKNHEVWHVFVLLGSLFHYVAILFYLV
ncbi:MAG: hemolysin III family protein [Leptospiraceae bacterium]|nr:hemolysin III family protein [Leptospiraceae bacterium]